MAVLNVIKYESLIENATSMGEYLKGKLLNIKGVKEVRGRGLMLGIDFQPEYSAIRNQLLLKVISLPEVQKTTLCVCSLPSLFLKEIDILLAS